MEWNKEEAVRAKDLAEARMQNKDFHGARKLALRAQQLYKEVENIAHMLMVCDVHCAAETKLFGNEMDWYGILQIEHTADESMIKKQYRKFALFLHPDKNKFPGAEAAFKLIGEAQRILLDKGQRSYHDMKRKAPASKPAPPYRPPQRAAYSSNVGVQNNPRSNFTGFNPQPQHMQQPEQQQQGFSNARATFWTACPFCSVKYQYYVEIMNKSLICQTCNKPFTAHERNVHGASTTGPNFAQSTFPPRNGFTKVELNPQGKSRVEQSIKTEFTRRKATNLAPQKANGKKQRKKDVESESSESSDSDSSIETEDVVFSEARGNSADLRRSDRNKRKVTYAENLSDDEDFTTRAKREKGSRSFSATEEEGRNGLKDGFASFVKDYNGEKQKSGQKSSFEENGHNRSNEVDNDSESEPEMVEYPDPDFNDFDKIRNDDCFSVGQIWAVYDTLDAMPRFYARIRRVFSPEFKLKITWMEPNPYDEETLKWVKEDLPAACGEFKHGKTENTVDRLMFSHKIQWEKGFRKDTYKIYPRTGEIWAIFKNWDINWKSYADDNLKFEYEFVEIVSEYEEHFGASVAYLGKVKGFVSVFSRTSKEGRQTFRIPPNELFRFSHMIPSFKLTGEERQGVPKGSFELDPASLPQNIEEISVPEDTTVDTGKTHDSTGPSSSDKAKSDLEQEPEVANDHGKAPTSTLEALEIPEPEFFSFGAEKSFEKFQSGQVWSLYSTEDGLPKCYGIIANTGSSGEDFNLQLRPLVPCGLPNDITPWYDKEMPICCGRFRWKSEAAPQIYSSADSFSHQLSAEPLGNNEYFVFPRSGQVWALYRNWSTKMSHHNLTECKYDVVEVLEGDNLSSKVSVLEKVEGYNSVFKPRLQEGSAFTMQVRRAELLRFSHHIPAFRLTEEKDGSLKGFWELDPAAVPVHYFST